MRKGCAAGTCVSSDLASEKKKLVSVRVTFLLFLDHCPALPFRRTGMRPTHSHWRWNILQAHVLRFLCPPFQWLVLLCFPSWRILGLSDFATDAPPGPVADRRELWKNTNPPRIQRDGGIPAGHSLCSRQLRDGPIGIYLSIILHFSSLHQPQPLTTDEFCFCFVLFSFGLHGPHRTKTCPHRHDCTSHSRRRFSLDERGVYAWRGMPKRGPRWDLRRLHRHLKHVVEKHAHRAVCFGLESFRMLTNILARRQVRRRTMGWSNARSNIWILDSNRPSSCLGRW